MILTYILRVTAIAQQDSKLLTKLNSILRMIDLTSKLLAPVSTCKRFLHVLIVPIQLFVSLLTASVGYPITAVIIAAQNALALIVELWWIKVVYNRFPILRIDEDRRKERRVRLELEDHISVSSQGSATTFGAWVEFASMPIFFGWSDDQCWYSAEMSLYSCIGTSTHLAGYAFYGYVLRDVGRDFAEPGDSLDGVAVSFFKAGRGWDDWFLAAIRV